jgi:hypothetical protein
MKGKQSEKKDQKKEPMHPDLVYMLEMAAQESKGG